MNKTIVAIYDDIVVARQVVEDLVSANFSRDSIRLITNDANNQYSHYLDKDYVPRADAVTAREGAGFGAVVGALTGLLLGVIALTLPNIGMVIAAGPILGTLTGLVAGVVTGGIVGALIKSRVPEDQSPYYAEGIRRGGTLISIQTADTLRAKDIMNRNGATNIHERINRWRQAGWKGFNTNPVENEETAPSPEAMFPTAPPVMPIPNSDPADNRQASPLIMIPVVEAEPPIDDEDTAKALAVLVTAPTTDPAVPVSPNTDLMP
jgi:uncharacterized membrane protein